MFITEKMNETNVEGIAELEKENFSDGWSLNSLKEEINNPNACYYVLRDDENGKVAAAAGMIISIDTADIMNVSVKGSKGIYLGGQGKQSCGQRTL